MFEPEVERARKRRGIREPIRLRYTTNRFSEARDLLNVRTIEALQDQYCYYAHEMFMCEEQGDEQGAQRCDLMIEAIRFVLQELDGHVDGDIDMT
jgi:hypothetical protein